MICHYRCFLEGSYKYESEVCSGCHDILMTANDLKNIAILNIKGVNYGCVIWNKSTSDAINRLNNSKLDDKGSLSIWTLWRIKHLSK